MGKHLAQLSRFSDETIKKVTDSVIPHFVNSVYSFAGGVALVTSLSTVVAQYLNYFAFTAALTFTSPLALFAGLTFAYLKYLESCERKIMTHLLNNKIDLATHNIEQTNKTLKKSFQNNPHKKEEQEALSKKAGQMIYTRPAFADNRSFAAWAFDFVTHFIADAGLTVGVSAFILASFTSIPFVGLPLTCVIMGGLLMATLTAYFIHRKRYKFTVQIESKKEELDQKSHLNSLYSTWITKDKVTKTPTAIAWNSTAAEEEKGQHSWYIPEKLAEGYLKGTLDEIYAAINEYLVRIDIISLKDIASQKDSQPAYWVQTGRITQLGDTLYQRANTAVGATAKNLMLALKVALLIEEYENNPERYAMLIRLIGKLRAEARKNSPWRLFCLTGNSRLADRIDSIFSRADQDARQLIHETRPFPAKELKIFEQKLDQKFQDYTQLKKQNAKNRLCDASLLAKRPPKRPDSAPTQLLAAT